MYNKYNSYLDKSNGLRENTLKNFTLDNMHDKFTQLMDTYVKKQPQFIPFNASKMQIPKLNKI